MTKNRQFLLVSIKPKNKTEKEIFLEFKELKELVDAYDGKVVDFVVQNREVHDKGLYLGQGKIQEVRELIKIKRIDIVVLNAIIKPGQLFDMKNFWIKSNPDIEVWDRVDLILHIFARHARTAEARLQIELASMRHMGPRIYGMGEVLSRQGGSIGTRGIGETNTERMKRHWREQMKATADKLEKLILRRYAQHERRRKNGILTLSIIGYTNAGKTSLFNLLTGKDKTAKDSLFVTLDSAVGKVYSKNLKRDLLVSDTIGFITNLPAKLIDAFKSTLMESINADILIQLIDISDDNYESKIEAVNKILIELGIAEKTRIFVFNKIDKEQMIDRDALVKKYKRYFPVFTSVKKKRGIDSLLEQVEGLIINTEKYSSDII